MSVFENVINEANKKNEVKNVTPESVEVADEGEGKKSFAERMAEKKNQCYAMIDDACLNAVSSIESLRQFLNVQSRFDKYSLNNALLIFEQKPDAVKLKELAAWNKEDISVKKGAKSIMILEPSHYKGNDGKMHRGYNAKHVFDIADVEAPEDALPQPKSYEQKQLVAALVHIILNSIAGGQFPCDMERLAVAVISNLRLSPADASGNIHDVNGGLYNRLRSASFKANTIKELVSLTETKKYTNARIYRAIWYSYLGVTSSDVKKAPEYTQLLAMDKQGRACLKEIGKRSSIPVLTKPSRLSVLSDKGRRQKALSDRADSVFQLTKPEPPSGSFSLTFTPFVKK